MLKQQINFVIKILKQFYKILQKTFVTATTTRRKQQQEMLNRALIAEEDRRKSARENFHVTSVPVNYLAAYEPALHHGDANEYDDGMFQSIFK